MTWHEELDALLEEYLALKYEIKVKSLRLKEISDWCKERGSFATPRYVCAVKLQTRTGLAGLETVASALGRSILEEHDLIRVSEFLLVYVSKKGRDNVFEL